MVKKVSDKENNSQFDSGNRYYEDNYLPEINRAGKIMGWLGIIVIFLPVLAVTFIYGIVPKKELLIIAVTAQLSVNAVWWIIEPISFYPILGVPGTYIAFLTGNVSNLRIPCAAAAQKAADVEPGSEESIIISTIGIVSSVYVNVILLLIAVIIGSRLLQKIPESVVTGLNFLLPSLFGAVFAQFAIDDKKTGSIAMIIAILSLIMYNKGYFNWFPIDPFIAVILIPIFGTILAARYMYSKGMYKEE